MKLRKIGRRRLMVSAGLVAIGTGFGLTFRWPNGNEIVLHYDDLLGALARFEALGTEYRSLFPEDNDPRQMMTDVFGEMPLETESADRLLAAVRNRVRQDYLDGRIITPRGWVLSRTEGRLAALPHLLAQRQGLTSPSDAARRAQ